MLAKLHPHSKQKELVKELEERLGEKEAEVRELNLLLRQKEAVIVSLGAELTNLRQQLQSRQQLAAETAAAAEKVKRVAVSAEPSTVRTSEGSKLPPAHQKPKKSKDLIREAILDNDFLKNLDDRQIEEIVDCMYPTVFNQNDFIIQEGEVGHEVYVLEEGAVEVSKEGKHLQTMAPGKVFGELAILYNCTRTASVRAVRGQVRLWAIDRTAFQTIMMKTNQIRHKDYVTLLRRLDLFASLAEETMERLADTIEEKYYDDNDYIIRHGAHGNQMYLVRKGQCKLTRSENSHDSVTLKTGDYFGEESLRGKHTAHINNVIVTCKEGCVVLIIDHESYMYVVGREESGRDAGDLELAADPTIRFVRDAAFKQQLSRSDFSTIATLGVGGFGRVLLVRLKAGTDDRTFALKVMKKKHIVDTRQQEHVMNEKNIMISCNCDFIVRLMATFKDSKFLYMVTEACLGGELWTILRDRSCFDDGTTRFYTACVLEAVQYLHSNGIVYRDLKPENMLLDTKGYVKMCDFGFAKKIGNKKTWTFCGTPEYVPPEIIMNKGHDLTADYWSLGVLMFELLTGNPPFVGNDPMKTYNIILKGIGVITFPRRVTKTAQSLIRSLCSDSVSERLGARKGGGIQEIKKHKWFDGFNWEGLDQRTLRPPIIPVVNSTSDVRNFDRYDEDTDPPPPDDLTGWDNNF